MRGRLWGLALALAGLALAGSAAAPAAAGKSGPLRAGAAAVKITPALSRPVYIAGYENNRLAESVHDDLWARAVVLDDGKTRFATVVCDLVGLSNLRVRQIRGQIRSVPPENVLITTTHVHSGPDTMGLWGKDAFTSGMDPLYMERLTDRIVAAVDTAARSLQPVTVTAGVVRVPDGLVYNSRESVQDKELTALQLKNADGRTVATVVHYGGHPEVNKSKALTSDYVHYVREAVEAEHGGVALYLNGALGGMVTPKIKEHTLPEMERVGRGVGAAALRAIAEAKPIEIEAIELRRRSVSVPLENSGFKLMLGAKILEGELRDGALETEVWRVDLGPVTWITIPGEILPRPALALKKRMPGRYPMVVSMANDELGYILDPDDYGKDRYKYERSMSVGKETWPRLEAAARELLR
ncbi:MAG: neutral/alkaline non-lysosomal ceramidase N-terminal domain-containing protein [Armatimonadota bacterium]